MPLTVCTGRGSRLVAPDNQRSSLVGSWSFDDESAHDESGHKHNLFPAPEVGPARWGVGASARFNGTTMSMTDFAVAHGSNEMTVMFWIYLLEDSIGSWRTILRKGDNVQMTPTMQLWSKERRLHARVTTEAGEVEGVDSVAVVPLRRWTHVAFVIQGKLLQLYVNGIFDSQVVTRRAAAFNRLPLYLGRDPWHPGTGMLIDTLKVYQEALDEEIVRAEAKDALGPVGASEVRLGCLACKLEDAMGSCSTGYHLCTKKELFGGAYTVARAQGWMTASCKLWSAENAHRTQVEQSSQELLEEDRLALCCAPANAI